MLHGSDNGISNGQWAAISDLSADAYTQHAERMICRTLRDLVEVSKLAREGRGDYLLVESSGNSATLPAAEPCLVRRTALTFPLFPPPQKN